MADMPDLIEAPKAEPGRRSAGPQRSEAAHDAMLDAAEALLIEAGPGAVTFEAVARRAKAGKPTLYRHWPNKAALLLELYDRHKDRVISAPNLGSLRADLIEITQRLWAFWRETSGGAVFAALIAEAQSDPQVRRTLVDHFANHARSPVTTLLQQAIDRGELPDNTDIEAVSEANRAVNWYHLITGRLDSSFIPDVINRFVDGVLPRG